MANNLINQIKDAGIVGAGGAGFPTYFKLESARGKVDTFIINAAECEPLLKVDQQILKIYPEKIVNAAVIVGEFLGVKKIIVGIKEKYHDTVEILKRTIKQYSNIEIYLLENFYPAGDEFSLVYEITGKIIPEGGLPLQVGCVVNNVVSLLNIFNAVDSSIPVVTRPVTVVGEVRSPKTLIVPVGTLIKDLLKFCGGTTIEKVVVIDGGPMMGKPVTLDDVVTKRTSGILVLPENHPVIIMKTLKEHQFLYQIKSACEQCQDCTEVCPRYLLGHNFECHKIQRSISYRVSENMRTQDLEKLWNDDFFTQVYLCCECGLCDWICPMNLFPRRTNQMVKQKLVKRGIKNPYNKKPDSVRETKEYRKVPPERLISRFDLSKYVHPATIELDTKEVEIVKIPLVQHLGVPTIPTVKTGDRVKKGDLIADIPDGKLGAKVHSSIDGKVSGINGYIKIET